MAKLRCLGPLLLASVIAGVLPSCVDPTSSPSTSEDERGSSEVALGALPLYFVENRGQLDAAVRYYVQGSDASLYFTHEGLTLSLATGEDGRWALKQDFVGASREVIPAGRSKTPAVVSYFRGPRDSWRTGLPTYRQVVYENVWPGIDVVYSGTANRFKYTFIVHPGADPGDIRVTYRGATGMRLDSHGRLVIEGPDSPVIDDAPSAHQRHIDGSARVAVSFALESAPPTYGFDVGPYDRSETLIIDPAVIVYAGFIGGTGDENVHELGGGIAVDGSGNAYVTGSTSSTDFPVAVGPDLTSNGGTSDAFVAKVNPEGTALVYAGYIGGSGDEEGNGVAVDGSGDGYVVGETTSTETTFPVTVGPDLTFNGDFGDTDAFVAKVTPDGTALSYAGYIGGMGLDDGEGVALDGSGNAYLAGTTGSTEATFPVKVGPDLTFNGSGGDLDAFVAEVNSDGAGLSYAGYIGGDGVDFGEGIAVDGQGSAYVTGNTQSRGATFPVTVGPDLTYNGGTDDAFAAKVDPGGTALSYAGYIGGSGDFDFGHGIAVDGSGSAYVTGQTNSREATFPVKVGPDLTYNGGGRDAFVAKVSAGGTSLSYAGYIGGDSFDGGNGIAVDGSGNAYVAGWTDSFEMTFPVKGGPDLTYNGSGDDFVAKVRTDGARLDYAGYIGGRSFEGNLDVAVAVDGLGNAYVTGSTASTDFPVTVGPDLTYNGGTADAFVAKVCDVGCPSSPVARPDALIKLSTQASYVGDDVYNATASGQTRTVKAGKGTSRTFNIKGENDGSVADSYALKSTCSTAKGFTVTYKAGATNITGQVSAGTYRLDSVPAGGSATITLTIKVGKTAKSGSSKSCTVTVTSTTDPTTRDAVRAKVLAS